VIQAETGVAAMAGEPDGPPELAGYSAVDNSSGIMAALGLVAKVLEGRGGQVDVSLFDVMLSQLNYKAAAYLNNGVQPARRKLGAHTFYVPAQLFETASGYLALFVTNDGAWRRLCAEVGRPQWADDPRYASMQARFEHRDQLLEELGAVLRATPAAEWVRRLRPVGIAVGEVVGLADALDADLVRSRGMVVSVDTPTERCAWSAIRFGARTRVRTTARPRTCTSTRARCSGRRRPCPIRRRSRRSTSARSGAPDT
jgi:crotonobetainyl-CoA:carnitine CoA-transferase CaiB-like acyl-CoA transferase